jgi:hypothetical protein
MAALIVFDFDLAALNSRTLAQGRLSESQPHGIIGL